MCSIRHTRGRNKKAALYQDLIRVTRMSLSYIEPVYQALAGLRVDPATCTAWLTEVAHYRVLIERVIEQTERRVFHGEKVPAREKSFSLFEAHTDIIVKGSRDIQYGHKLNLMTGQSGLVLDVMIEAGISYLKRCFGLRRCNWKGLEHFKAYVWSAVVTHNMVRLARLKPA